MIGVSQVDMRVLVWFVEMEDEVVSREEEEGEEGVVHTYMAPGAR